MEVGGCEKCESHSITVDIFIIYCMYMTGIHSRKMRLCMIFLHMSYDLGIYFYDHLGNAWGFVGCFS